MFEQEVIHYPVQKTGGEEAWPGRGPDLIRVGVLFHTEGVFVQKETHWLDKEAGLYSQTRV